jgi:hypothetical protein
MERPLLGVLDWVRLAGESSPATMPLSSISSTL